MMRVVFVVLLLSLNILANMNFTDEERNWIAEHRNSSFTFTGHPNFLPFEAFDENGKYIGIVSEYLDLIEKKSGFKFLPILVNQWEDTLELSKTRQVSIVSGDITDAVLNENYLPVDSYILNPIIILMNHKHTYIKNLNSIQEKKIAIIDTDNYADKLCKEYDNINFIKVKNLLF